LFFRPNSTSSDSKIIELNHVEEDPDEHVDDSGSEKTLDSSSIARQIKLMNLDYAKLTLLQKIDQLSEEIQEGVRFLKFNFYCLRTLK